MQMCVCMWVLCVYISVQVCLRIHFWFVIYGVLTIEGYLMRSPFLYI